MNEFLGKCYVHVKLNKQYIVYFIIVFLKYDITKNVFYDFENFVKCDNLHMCVLFNIL